MNAFHRGVRPSARAGALLRKLAEMAVTLLLATLVLFVLTHMAPGDPVRLMLGEPEIGTANSEAYRLRYAEMRRELRLDDNLFLQYGVWLGRLFRFDLGHSIHTRRPVRTELLERLPATLQLALPALSLQLVLGTVLGVASAVNRGRMTDHAIRVGCVVLASVPVFALGLALLYFFGVRHALYTIANEAGWGRLWLPATTLGLIAAPPLARMIRTNLLQEFGRPYILAALSRGLRRRQIVRGAFRNVLLPVVTMTALSAASLVGGAVVVESVFSWPGIGKYALDSILLHDHPVIQGYGFVTIVMILLINLGVDIVYICLDPRLRGRSGYGNAEGEAHA